MRRCHAALLVTALAAAATFLETRPEIRSAASDWLASNALPGQPETIMAIEMDPPGPNITSLDAALLLRAVLRHSPKAVVFLDPVSTSADDPLLTSKLSEAKIPVVLTANENLQPLPAVAAFNPLPPLPPTGAVFQSANPAGCVAPVAQTQVLLAAGSGGSVVPSNVWMACLAVDGVQPRAVDGRIPGWLRAGATYSPIDAAGRANINPQAAQYLKRMGFNQLMLRTERSEQGTISADLEGLFRGRIVAVQIAGGNRALGLAAVRNDLADAAPPGWLGILAALPALTLPWWRGSRRNRALLALLPACGWLFLAPAIYHELRMPVPLLGMLLLPLLALIPSDETKKRKLPS